MPSPVLRALVIAAALFALLVSAPLAGAQQSAPSPAATAPAKKKTTKKPARRRKQAARPAAPAAPATIGIAEQQPSVFADPLFTATKIHDARLLVGWNGIFSSWQRDQIDAWLGAARAAGVDPLVTFGRSRTDFHQLPTPAQFAAAFQAFRQRYPWVHLYATWNEANLAGEAVYKRPDLVARFWRGMRASCPGCTILAAELVDLPNIQAWTSAFRIAARTEPAVWGLHNYLDANLFTTSGTRSMLAAVPGDIWLTETGGIVSRHNNSKVQFPEGEAHAAAATRFVLDRLTALSPRIRRVYLYDWQAQSGVATWDSGLMNADGTARPAYLVLKSRVERVQALAARRRAAVR
ncbi:MAG TPA: hypothetical protein VII98_06320 [Solirubrobacteraceae bacterium]